jgi:hypothetical protein
VKDKKWDASQWSCKEREEKPLPQARVEELHVFDTKNVIIFFRSHIHRI